MMLLLNDIIIVSNINKENYSLSFIILNIPGYIVYIISTLL